jgi:uncharacterized membrane protein YhhN
MSRTLLILYLALALMNLFAEQSGQGWLVLLTKPLLLSVLSFWFWREVRPLDTRFKRFLLLGLIFSIGGDTLLMFVEQGPKQEDFFLLGLGSFLVAQLCYAYGFAGYPEAKRGDLARQPLRAWPFALYLIGILGALWTDIPPGLRLPVSVYATAIVVMALAAFNLRGLLPRARFLGLMTGVLLFVISDSLIAFNKFGQPIPYARLLIMGTYLSAQFLIAWHAAAVVKSSYSARHSI